MSALYLSLLCLLADGQDIATQVKIVTSKKIAVQNQLISISRGNFKRVESTDNQGNILLRLTPGRYKVCPLEVEDSLALYNCKYFDLPLNSKDTFKVVLGFAGITMGKTIKVGQGDQFGSVNRAKLAFLPGLGQSADIIKLLPGVFSQSELTSQYNVRGGNYDENLIYVNGIEIYRPQLVRSGQQEGLGFLNTDLINNLTFYPGGFEAKYGDKLSSALDVEYIEPDTQLGGSATASFLGGSISLYDRPNRNFYYVAGVRYRANNYILNSLDVQGQYRPIFYDIQLLLSYKPGKKKQFLNWSIDYLGNLAQNKFSFAPVQQTTRFGTINRPLELTVGYAGLEVMNYTTATNALSIQYKPSIRNSYRFTNSLFNALENEYYTVEGAYNLGELDNNLGSDNFGQRKQTLGLGYFINHARNDLQSWVYNSSFDAIHKVGKSSNTVIEWGLNYRQENFDDRVLEWRYNDSAEMNLSPFQGNDDSLFLNSYVNSSAILRNDQSAAYLQIKKPVLKRLNGVLNIGSRVTHRSLGRHTFFSPRIRLSFDPYHSINKRRPDSLKKQMELNFSAGYYYQPAFYREMRDLQGNLNTQLAPQKSIHILGGMNYFFRIRDRQFKYSLEAYYKHLDDIIPYAIDNVRIRYYAVNSGWGYAAGIDNRIYGEFIKDLESWFNLSILSTQERFTYTENGVELTTPWLRRQTDARVVSSIFFRDELPNNKNYSMSLMLNFVSGVPYYFIEGNRFTETGNRIPGYQRVDLGFQKIIVSEEKALNKKWAKHLKNAFISLDVFNLLGNNNVVAYNIVKDFANNYYGVPNFLTGRRINLRFYVGF